MAGSVLVGMSGGVDSSVAAATLKDAGYRVFGLSLRLFESRGKLCSPTTQCCSAEALGAAASTAAALGIEHRVVDCRDAFFNYVVHPFMEAYLRGATPNPCILCNEAVKFPVLLREARNMGFEHIATGHYARVTHSPGGTRLMAGADPSKDQSYFLYSLDSDVLEALLLPLGQMDKPSVRQCARELGLPVFDRPESQEICFVGEGGHGELIAQLAPEAVKEGPVIGPEGKVVGTHKGIVHYTLGQRRGLGVALGYPAYITAIDARANAIHVGPVDAVMRSVVKVGQLKWLAEAGSEFKARVKIRSAMRPAEAVVRRTDMGVEVRFAEPQLMAAPEQAAVFYDGHVVVGGGKIRL